MPKQRKPIQRFFFPAKPNPRRHRVMEQVLRLANARAASRLDIVEWIKNNKEEIDKISATIAGYSNSGGGKNKAGRREPRLRNWHSLTEGQKKHFFNKITRAVADPTNNIYFRNDVKEQLYRAGILPETCDITSFCDRAKELSRISSYVRLVKISIQQGRRKPPRECPDVFPGTPQERLRDLRMERLATTLDFSHRLLTAEFYYDLHPADTELEPGQDNTWIALVNVNFHKMSEVLQTPVLSAVSYLVDGGIEVFYAAIVVRNRRRDALRYRLERAYLARTKDIKTGKWVVTSPYAKPANALVAARAMIAKSMTSVLAPTKEELEEG
jgi:hypothetical protein